MEDNKAQRICKICFIVLFVITFILMCVLPGDILAMERSNDDKYLDGVVAALAFILLFFLLLHELLFYIGIHYFLGARERKSVPKNVFFFLLLAGNLTALCVEFIHLLP